jgi:hypothetical protein
LIAALHFKPERETTVSRFPTSFRDALAITSSLADLGGAWANSLRQRRMHAKAAAKSEGFTGRDEPPLDLAQLTPFLSKLAADLVELARVARATNRELYVHSWLD